MVEYKSGVCLCTNTTPNSSGTRVFSSTVEYALKDVDKETNTCPEDPNYSHCDLLLGEYIIDPDVFTESVIARLGSIIKPFVFEVLLLICYIQNKTDEST